MSKKWTNEKPTAEGYYFYIGPVQSHEYKSKTPCKRLRIAKVSDFGMNELHVIFIGTTVEKYMNKIIDTAMWSKRIELPYDQDIYDHGEEIMDGALSSFDLELFATITTAINDCETKKGQNND